MASRRPSSGSPHRLKADVESSTPMKVLKALAADPEVAGQIGMMSRKAPARALAAIDKFYALFRLPALHPHLTMRMQHEIDRQRALRARSAHPR